METDIPESVILTIRRLLLAAYDKGRRDLPWRGETDPYRIWVSEVMLQQTRVETVIPYYKEWVARFPDLGSLAAAEEEAVLKAWQGLGYYSRAQRLLGGARVVRERFGGTLPTTAAELKNLPGVGEYTSGAVASIAFGEVVPAVDGNVRRVLSRLFDLPDPGVRELRDIASALVDPQRPGDFNQALMEHGALVCTPQRPMCVECPLRGVCESLRGDTVLDRPVRKVRKRVPEKDILVLVGFFRQMGADRFFLRKRPEGGLLAGMWEFPGIESAEAPEESGGALLGLAQELGFIPVRDPISLNMVPHGFTHLKVRYWPYALEVTPKRPGTPGGEAGSGRWVTPGEMGDLPLPVAQRKIARLAMSSPDLLRG